MSTGPTLVLVDAKVLYSRACRDWIARAATLCRESMFRLHWTEDILAEWMYHLRRANPHAPDSQIGQKRRDLERAFPRALITGYPVHASLLQDVNDSHVHSAALHAGVGKVITDDRGFHDLSDDVRDSLPYEVWRPDDFLELIGESSHSLLLDLVEDQLKYWGRRNPDGVDLPGRLRAANLRKFAVRVEEAQRYLALCGY